MTYTIIRDPGWPHECMDGVAWGDHPPETVLKCECGQRWVVQGARNCGRSVKRISAVDYWLNRLLGGTL